MATGAEFVDGWVVAQVLGEGSYGEVRLLVHARSGASVALKAVRGEGGAREAALHRALRHPNVLRCLGDRPHVDLHYLFLEYAQGGELFDRIEPDVGMGEAQARRLWRQLAAGLRYLRARGVAHRDLKPENLLLDARDTLKISDFGMATLFRHGTRERLMTRVCGTLPYAAPEVLAAATRPYRAPPADLWAAAVVLLAMLAGELPWERAAEDDARFAAWSRWARGGPAPLWHSACVWRKVSAGALALLRGALQPAAARRHSLHDVLHHPWMRDTATPAPPPAPASHEGTRVWSSQPVRAAGGLDDVDGGAAGGGGGGGGLSAADMDAMLSYSQPTRADELLLPDSGDALTQTQSGGGVLQRLVRRMTRVWVRCDEARALAALESVLGRLQYTYRRLHPRILAIECEPHGAEARKLCMRAWALRAAPAAAAAGGEGGEGRVVLEFRRSRGCGLAFKRHFLRLREALQPLAAPPPPHRDLLAAVAAVADPRPPTPTTSTTSTTTDADAMDTDDV